MIAVVVGMFFIGPFALLLPIFVFAIRPWLLRKILEQAKEQEALAEKVETKAWIKAKVAAQTDAPRATILGQEKSVTERFPSYGHYRDRGSGKSTVSYGDTDADSSDFRINVGRELSSGSEVLFFTYIDANGVVTEREVSPWTEHKRYIRGYCFMAGAERTFRKDRIEQWWVGSETLLREP